MTKEVRVPTAGRRRLATGTFQRRQGLGPKAYCLAELLKFLGLQSCRDFLTSQNGIGRLASEIAQSGTVTNGEEQDR